MKGTVMSAAASPHVPRRGRRGGRLAAALVESQANLLWKLVLTYHLLSEDPMTYHGLTSLRDSSTGPVRAHPPSCTPLPSLAHMPPPLPPLPPDEPPPPPPPGPSKPKAAVGMGFKMKTSLKGSKLATKRPRVSGVFAQVW